MYVRISIARVIHRKFSTVKFLLRGFHILSREFCSIFERPIKDMGSDNGCSRMLCESLLWKGLQCHKKGRRQSFIETAISSIYGIPYTVYGYDMQVVPEITLKTLKASYKTSKLAVITRNKSLPFTCKPNQDSNFYPR